MSFRKNGIGWKMPVLKKGALLKLVAGLLASNLLFYYLFGPRPEVRPPDELPQGWVEMRVEGFLRTPYADQKRVLLVHRSSGLLFEARLTGLNREEGALTVWVAESHAQHLFQKNGWEILPYMKSLSVKGHSKGATHEIRY